MRPLAGLSGGLAALWIFGGLAAASMGAETLTGAWGGVNALDPADGSARSVIWGPAFTALADDADALFSNPAGLTRLSVGEVGLGSRLGWTGIFQESLLMGIPLGSVGGLGLAVGNLDFGSFEGRDGNGALTGNYGANRQNLNVGCGFNLLPDLAVGLGWRTVQENLDGTGYFLWTPDFGVLLQAAPGMTLGLDYAAGAGGTWKGSQLSTWRLGASLDRPLDPSVDCLAALGYSRQSDLFQFIQGGAEISFQRGVFLRAGWNAPLQPDGGSGYAGLSLGAGLILAGIRWDYAYLPGGDLGSTHLLSLTYQFEPEPSKASEALKSPQPAPPGGHSDSLTVKFSIPSDFFSQAQAMESQGQWAQAVTLYQEDLQENPSHVGDLTALGRLDLRLGRSAEARDCFKRALLLEPKNPAARQGLRDCR